MIIRTLPAFLLVPLIAGCGPDRPNTVYESASNPAAAFCEAESGFYTPGTNTCTLASGDVVDAEAHYLGSFR